MKRAADVILSLIGLVILLPVFLIAAFAIVLDSGFPVFFKQQRVGLNGRKFGMFKFRSMRQNAAASGPYFTQANDVRITKVGQLLRRTSIDELPQLINVLLGDMSLVGPRPDVPVQESLYSTQDWKLRCSVRPGITGLAQVNGRSNLPFEDRLAMDLDYARQACIWLDMKIIWQTARQLGGKHAN